jgi:hypothetical protein
MSWKQLTPKLKICQPLPHQDNSTLKVVKASPVQGLFNTKSVLVPLDLTRLSHVLFAHSWVYKQTGPTLWGLCHALTFFKKPLWQKAACLCSSLTMLVKFTCAPTFCSIFSLNSNEREVKCTVVFSSPWGWGQHHVWFPDGMTTLA